MSGGQLEYANFLGMWKEESKSPLINISFIHLSAQCSAWHNLNIFASCIINVSLKLAPRPPANYGLLRSHFILGARGVSLRSQFSHWKKDKGIRAKNAKPKTDSWNLPANFFWVLFFLNVIRNFKENYASTLRAVRSATAEYVNNLGEILIFQQPSFLRIAFFFNDFNTRKKIKSYTSWSLVTAKFSKNIFFFPSSIALQRKHRPDYFVG